MGSEKDEMSSEHRSAKTKRGGAGSKQSPGRVAWEWAKSLSVALILFLIIRSFLVEAFKIPTGSMENTLLVGDFLLVNKAVYGAQVPFTNLRLPAFDEPEKGDVVVFRYPRDPSKNYVKRLIGVPGDTLAMRAGVLYVNGEQQGEDYVRHVQPDGDHYDPQFEWQKDYLAPGVDLSSYHPTRDDWGPIIVPEDKFFVLGDNRDNSLDSRYWGFVDRDLIKGRPLIIYYSFEKDRLSPLPWLTEVRWSRVGNVIH